MSLDRRLRAWSNGSGPDVSLLMSGASPSRPVPEEGQDDQGGQRQEPGDREDRGIRPGPVDPPPDLPVHERAAEPGDAAERAGQLALVSGGELLAERVVDREQAERP